MEKECRSLTTEVSTEHDEGTLTRIEGYAFVFDAETVIAGSFTEVVRRGFGERAVAAKEIVALANHDTNLVLGSQRSGTLELEFDEVGLRYSILVPDTQTGRDWLVLAKRGDIAGSSFSFNVTNERWTYVENDSGGYAFRELLDGDIYDVGPVTTPAYAAATVSARAIEKSTDTQVPAGLCDNEVDIEASPTCRRGILRETDWVSRMTTKEGL